MCFCVCFFLFCSIFVLNNYDNWSVPHKYHILDTSWVADSTQQFRHRHTKNRIYKDSHISISYLYVFDLFIRFKKKKQQSSAFQIWYGIFFSFAYLFAFATIWCCRFFHYLSVSLFISRSISYSIVLSFVFFSSLFWSAAN